MENEEEFVVLRDPHFPLDDVLEISKYLINENCLVPGYMPPSVGMLDIQAIFYMQNVEQLELTVLPDRNLVSSIINIAKVGYQQNMDRPTRVAASLMAYCQCLNIQIEPSVAFHEVAQHSGNKATLNELGWFRAADEANPTAWLNIALGRQQAPIAHEAKQVDDLNIAFPLHRWRRNYVVALKVAELELSDLSPRVRMLRLLEWMMSDFILAGPAAMLAAIYFSPKAAKKGMFKKLRSSDREKALLGIRNETWDMTHLSDLVQKVEAGKNEGNRYMFASADNQLKMIAPFLFSTSDDFAKAYEQVLNEYWPANDTRSILLKCQEACTLGKSRSQRTFEKEQLDRWIEKGENLILHNFQGKLN